MKKKISGLLIQNTLRRNKIKSTIVGIGLNINQENFGSDLSNATSLLIEENVRLDVGQVFDSLMLNMNNYYIKLQNEKFDILKDEFESKIYRLNELSRFYLANGELVKGIIKGVKESGELSVEIGGEKRQYIHGEIKLVFNQLINSCNR